MKKHLRFCVAGNVDDGKSTLIGRILLDSGSLLKDQLEALKGNPEALAHITDGLRSEREQGITIDVAYRYFATPKRKFILADTPGHVEYTRNMATAASKSDLAVILISADKGVREQTRRHIYLCHLLGIKQLVFAINKLDLFDYSQDVYNKIKVEVEALADKLSFKNFQFIPISALLGHNIVTRSKEISWYDGPALLEYLEAVDTDYKTDSVAATEPVFSVQYVVRTQHRYLMGSLLQGKIQTGSFLKIAGKKTPVKVLELLKAGEVVTDVQSGDAIAIRLDTDVDVGRGTVLLGTEGESVKAMKDFDVVFFWLNDSEVLPQERLEVQHLHSRGLAQITEIKEKLNLQSYGFEPCSEVAHNDLGKASLRLAQPIYATSYTQSKDLGSLILVHPETHETLAACLVL
ncbi:MAG: sulfate adenylyltransferase subunit 1 [Pseudobdellovibrionaceae bacterium]